MNLENLGSFGTAIGGGFFAVILVGYALKKVVKIVAIVVGLFFAGLAYLQYQQIVIINWNNLQQVSHNAAITVLNATKYIPGLTNVSGHTTNLTMYRLRYSINWKHGCWFYFRIRAWIRK